MDSPDNSAESPQKQRGRPWKKGQSGNPAGRPEKGRSWAEAVKRISDMTLAELIEYVGPNTALGRKLKIAPSHLPVKDALLIASIVAYGHEPNASMLKVLSDREDGKPAQAVDITSKGESVVPKVIEIVKKYDE